MQVANPTLPQATTAQVPIPSPATLAMPPPPTKMPSTSSKHQSGSTKKRPSSKGSADSPPIEDIITEWEDKKYAKRAANRLSAHLSRKRKKMFIEDLKDENIELRRKEQILRSIPDLIVVFDSSGCISFVSHSVTRFLDYTVEDLENTSFWELITEDSVRLIKSAFMDALAVKRRPDEDSIPLANGESMKVTLARTSGNGGGPQEDMIVTLKGVVHFVGESPECVSSIRPEHSGDDSNKKMKVADNNKVSSGQTQRPSHQISDIESDKSLHSSGEKS